MNKEQMTLALRSIADKNWTDNAAPMLLSDVPLALQKELGEFDYRALLEGKSLKSFIKESGESGGFRLVEHASQRAKVGLAPLGAEFEFASAPPEATSTKAAAPKKSDNKALALLEILSSLPQKELDMITIPVSALVKLLK